MIERILLPTDGSPLSERAAPVCRTIAVAQGAEVILVSVVEPPIGLAMEESVPGGHATVDPETYDLVLNALDDAARRSLDRLAADLRSGSPSLRTRTLLFHGFPASTLLGCETEENVGLVVMATHGRTGLARFALGSVADRMVREGKEPVLLVRSFGQESAALQRALVPLDGSSVAEAALSMVGELAGRPVRDVRMLRVVEEAEEGSAASAYLHQVAAPLRGAGVTIETSVRQGNPAEAICAAAADMDLIVMATHGRGGWQRFRHGSVAERVVRDAAVPVLLVRARESA